MDHCPDSILEQARFWVVEIHDPNFAADHDSQTKFHNWLNRSAAHADAFARSSRTFQCLECLRALPEINLDDRIQRYRCEQKGAPRVPWRPWFAAAAALCLGVVLPLVPQQLTAAPTLYMTHVGEQRTVILADGWTLRLNSATRVLVRSPVGQYREIDVLEGETYFSLAPDLRRPIRIFSAADTITGNASEFDVSQVKGRVEVVAVRGDLSVMSFDLSGAPLTQHIVGRADRSKSNSISLRAGEMATIREQQDGANVLLDSRTPTDIERLLAWRDGLLAFSNQSAAAVVASFNRYNRQQMAIADHDIAQLRVSGNFQFNDPESFILALQRIYPTFKIVAQLQPTGAIVLSRRGSQPRKSTQQGADPVPM
jgi:transmembrane sensor